MRALVVYESMFGNTQTIAAAVAEGVARHLEVDVVEVGAAPTEVGDDVGLLVVGGPTHAFGLSRPATREDAAKQAGGPVVSASIGLREWLADLHGAGGTPAAAFDTHADKRVPGSAAKIISRRLRRLGFRMVAAPQSFFVSDVAGPLVAGEEARSRTWAAALAAGVTEPLDPQAV